MTNFDASVVEPTPEQVRAHISAGTCPWCTRGPFKMLPVHTAKAHGIDKWHLRELAQLTTNDPLCDPDTLRKFSEKAKAHPTVDAATAASRVTRSPQRWTTAGKAKVSENITVAMSAKSADERSAISRRAAASITPRGRENQRRAVRERMADPAERSRMREVLNSPRATERQRAAFEKYQATRTDLQGCGTRAAYRRGCRCADCVEANRAYKRTQRTSAEGRNTNKEMR